MIPYPTTEAQAEATYPNLGTSHTFRANITAQKTSQQRNAQGGLDVKVLVKQVVVSDIAQGNGGSIAQAMQSVYGLKRQQRGR